MRADLIPGRSFPDLVLPDHGGVRRSLSELAGGDPMVVQFYRGWFCPKERAGFLELLAVAERAEVACPGGVLAVWAAEPRPHPQARRVDPNAIDIDGPASAVSLVWPADDQRPLFDDPAVVQAVRQVASVPHLTAVSTLTVDPVHFAGSLLATAPWIAAGWPGWWAEDPFARLAPRRRLLVGPGLLAARVGVLGPGTQRRAGAPWPAGW